MLVREGLAYLTPPFPPFQFAPFANHVPQHLIHAIVDLIHPFRQAISHIAWPPNTNPANISKKIFTRKGVLLIPLISYFRRIRMALPVLGDNRFIPLAPLSSHSTTAQPLYFPIDYRVLRQFLIPKMQQIQPLSPDIIHVLGTIPIRGRGVVGPTKEQERQVFDLFFQKRRVRWKNRGKGFK